MDDKSNSHDIQCGSKDEGSSPEPSSERNHGKPSELSTGEDLEGQKERLPYPKSVFFIVSNEFCERFSFYGMRTILSLYLSHQLKFEDSTATVIFHLFIMICYFFPLMGAIIADSWLGKYKTIFYLSMVYAVGNIVMSMAAIPPLQDVLKPIPFTMLGLFLIGFGTGGIKPCVSAFGGDQFKLPQQEDQLQKFFSIFYFAINSGSFLSTFLTPILREVQCFEQDTCYCLAFGVPALLMILSIIVYFAGKRFYKIKEPEGNVVVKVAKCMWHAATTKNKKGAKHWLDKAEDKYDRTFIDDIKGALRVLVLYIPLPFFWALFDQQGSKWTFQASRMNGEIGSFLIQPDQMQVVNPILILAFIPLFETVLYPFLAKFNLLKRPLQKLTVGGILAGVAFGVSALVEMKLETTYPILPQPMEGQIRLFNGLPENLAIEIPDMGVKEFELSSGNVWVKVDIPVVDEKNFEVKYKKRLGDTQSMTVYENEATSYVFMPDRFLEIRNNSIEKSEKGNPKVMIIYSDPGNYQSKTIKLMCTDKESDFPIMKDRPFTDYTKIPLTNEKYVLMVDDQEVLRDIELKQGGVYAIVIVKGEKLKANVLTITTPNTVHMLWMIPQYVIMTAAEIMFSITGLEFSYSQAPTSMKSLLQAAWLLTVAMGNLIVVIIAEAKFFSRQFYEFLLFTGLMLLDSFIFALMAMRYTYVEDLRPPETDAEDSEKSESKG